MPMIKSATARDKDGDRLSFAETTEDGTPTLHAKINEGLMYVAVTPDDAAELGAWLTAWARSNGANSTGPHIHVSGNHIGPIAPGLR